MRVSTFKDPYDFKIHGGCGLAGFMNQDGTRVSGEAITRSMCLQRDRGNGLGSGYAGYGIYPDWADHFALHIMYETMEDKSVVDQYLEHRFSVDLEEKIPTRPVKGIVNPPHLYRYFIQPHVNVLEQSELDEHDFMVDAFMWINSNVEGAFVISSGKNMGAFKAVGFPEEVGEFYCLDEYSGYTWIGHNRFPTNTPGWWGGAHPFTILDWAIVHNGEISSYGINTRYLEMFGYKCTMRTDTEVVAYLFDLLLRKHGLSPELACKALASPFWKDIDLLADENQRELMTAIRVIYGGGLLNGPFALILGYGDGMIGLNDRIKLRPLVAAEKGDTIYLASEEAAIREISPTLDRVWSPKAGEPVIARLKKKASSKSSRTSGKEKAPSVAVTA